MCKLLKKNLRNELFCTIWNIFRIPVNFAVKGMALQILKHNCKEKINIPRIIQLIYHSLACFKWISGRLKRRERITKTTLQALITFILSLYRSPNMFLSSVTFSSFFLLPFILSLEIIPHCDIPDHLSIQPQCLIC